MGRGEKRSETRRNRRLNIKDGQMWALVAFTALSKLQWGWNVNNDINEKYAKGTGSPVFCEKEGVEVEVPWISSDPCISCKCQAIPLTYQPSKNDTMQDFLIELHRKGMLVISENFSACKQQRIDRESIILDQFDREVEKSSFVEADFLINKFSSIDFLKGMRICKNVLPQFFLAHSIVTRRHIFSST
ncbi:uncharacterized protein TNIN_133501 [Trichonephila inaurata madagascariensis]|uniref:Uncharacterized protein n=1 Tax=Trichonephila inaurata madagascariensis TaxID=2747483 RepID=A0A8X6WL07_9ARAC|nr:uncharacterized protein TNIN_133501 [Trichonephila inaurata madagascariensis]